MGRALQTTDLVFLVLFGIELIIKCVAMGVVLSPGSYLRSGELKLEWQPAAAGQPAGQHDS
jgi:hypothetical protein